MSHRLTRWLICFTTMNPHIVVVDNRWVFQSNTVTIDGSSTVLDNAVCVRRWGTTNGLGGLLNGPLTNTVLDPYGTVIIPSNRIVFLMPCEPWSR